MARSRIMIALIAAAIGLICVATAVAAGRSRRPARHCIAQKRGRRRVVHCRRNIKRGRRTTANGSSRAMVAVASDSSFVQGASGTTSATSMAVKLNAGVQGGDLLVGQFRTTGAATVSDSVNGQWTRAVQTTSGSVTHSIWYVANAKPGTTTITVSGASSGTLRAVVAEYSGVAPSGALDQTSCRQGTSSSASTGATGSAGAGELLFAGVSAYDHPISVTAGTGVIRTQITGSYGTSADEDETVAASGPQTASFTLNGASASTSWAACVATFRSAGTTTSSSSSSSSTTSTTSTAPTTTTISTPTTTTTTGTTSVPTPTLPNPGLLFDGTFPSVGSPLSSLWAGPGTWFAPNSVTGVPDPLGSAQNVGKFTVAPTDINPCCPTNPRADLESPALMSPTVNNDVYASIPVYVPMSTVASGMSNRDFAPFDGFMVAEAYGPPYNGSPPVSLDTMIDSNGQLHYNYIYTVDGSGHTAYEMWRSPAITTDGWHTFTLHIHWATDNTGFVELWFDGKPQQFTPSPYAGAVPPSSGPNGANTRLYYRNYGNANNGGLNFIDDNLYANHTGHSLTFYHGETKIGTSFDSVQPTDGMVGP